MAKFIFRFKKGLLIALTFGLPAFSVTIVSAQQVISLQKAIDLAMANNLSIKQSQITTSIATEDYKQSKYNQLPSLSVNPQGSYNFGRSPNLTTYSYTSQSFLYVNGQASLSLTLFQGGQLRNQILQNKIALDVDQTNTAKVKNDLLLNVVTDYLTILSDQDLVIAAKQQIDLAKITLDRAQKNFDQGAATRADLAQAQAQLSTAELNLTTAQNQVDIAIIILKQYMEMDPTTEIAVEKPDISKLTDVKTIYDASEVIKTSLSVNPDVRLAELQQQGYAQAIKVAKGAYYPTISLFGGLGSNYSSISQNVTGSQTVTAPIGYVDDGSKTPVLSDIKEQIIAPKYPFGTQFNNNFNQSIGINLQIPVFNHFSARTGVRKAKLNYEYAQLTTQLAKNTLSKTIIQALADLQAAVKNYQSALHTYESSKEALNVTKQRYDAGFVNTLDYNTAVTNYNKAQNDMINAQYSMIFRSKVIDYYLGNKIEL